ncbi:hypothetical protein HUU62_04800 [Rhodoferax sp. 4810]|nr:hypothetical protein [Rhodoferax jenense]
MSALKFVFSILIGTALVAALGYAFLFGSATVYASGGMFVDMGGAPIWRVHSQLREWGIPGIPDTALIRVEKIDLTHFPRNILVLYCSAALAVISLMGIVVGSIGVIIYGIGRGEWSEVGAGVGGLVLSPLIAIGVVLFPLGMLIGLLFQSCSPGYATSMTVLALPVLLAGMGTAAAPAYTVIVIVSAA